MKNKGHLTPEGFNKILSLESALNRGLSENLANIKGIKCLERPLHIVNFTEFKDIDPNWLAGFVADPKGERWFF